MQFIINPFTGELTPIGDSGGTEPILTIDGNSGSATPTGGGVVSIVGTGGVTTTGSGSSLTISISGAGFSWTDKSTSFSASGETGYFCNAALTATLPTAPSEGTTIKFIVTATSGNVVVQAGGTDIIQIGNAISAAGGSATTHTQSGSTINGTTLTLVYQTSSTSWWGAEGFINFWSVA